MMQQHRLVHNTSVPSEQLFRCECESAYRPVDHARGAGLSEREAGGRVGGRFWIHGERESGGCGQAAEGSLSLSGQRLSLTLQDL